jgi:histone H3/H4
MDNITKPSIIRLARKAGVKSLSEDCYSTVRSLIEDSITEVITTSLVVNSEHNSKTLMTDDIYEALHLLGYNVTQSNDMGTSTFVK